MQIFYSYIRKETLYKTISIISIFLLIKIKLFENTQVDGALTRVGGPLLVKIDLMNYSSTDEADVDT